MIFDTLYIFRGIFWWQRLVTDENQVNILWVSRSSRVDKGHDKPTAMDERTLEIKVATTTNWRRNDAHDIERTNSDRSPQYNKTQTDIHSIGLRKSEYFFIIFFFHVFCSLSLVAFFSLSLGAWNINHFNHRENFAIKYWITFRFVFVIFSCRVAKLHVDCSPFFYSRFSSTLHYPSDIMFRNMQKITAEPS